MVALVAAGAAVALAAWSWLARPQFVPLYSRLDVEEAARVVEALQQMGVPYRLTGAGTTVEVPRERVYAARLQLAAQGLPRSGGVGFELFDRSSFGASELVQRVNLQRALAGELVRSIETLDAVESARVHLAIPQDRLFRDEASSPSASVVVTLRTDAEFVLVPEANLVRKPANLSFEEAAAFPLVFLTAWNMLVTNARLRPGEDVLVWGAGSGVGSAAIQIAKAFQARVIAVAGDDWKLERARQLGADETVNHRTQDVLAEVRRLTDRRGVDVVFEHVGQATWEVSVKALARGGRLVTCGATSGPLVQTDVRYVFGRAVSVHGTWVGSKGELFDLLPLVERGVLRPVVDRVFPLSEVREAHHYLEAGQHFGKVVLVP